MHAWMMSSETSTESQPFEPWQFFTLAGLIGATIVVFFAKGQTAAAIILLSLIVFAAAAVGFAALRAAGPLAGVMRSGSSVPPASSRTRVTLEREKALALRAIKELEFDRAMGKVSDKDFTEMSGRLRARAARIIRQVDASGTYRERIEQEIAKRVGRVTNACPSCQVANDLDARFCKKCGTALGTQS
jgi:hypothetical protein